MFWPLKGHYQGVRAVTDTCTYMHTYNTSVHVQCEAIYDNTDVKDVNFMLSKVEVFEVYTYSYSLAKSVAVFLYKGVLGFFPGINLGGSLLSTDVLLVLRVVWRCTLIFSAS
jgi:hypothetical protein